jgi:hypothetical protein
MASKSNTVQQILSDAATGQYGSGNTSVSSGGLFVGAGSNLAPSVGNVGAGSTITFGDGKLGETFAQTVKDLSETQAAAVGSVFAGLQQNQAAQAAMSGGVNLKQYLPWAIGAGVVLLLISLLRRA